jgi:alanine-synthesizing transaminase
MTPPKASMFCWVPIPEPWRSRMSTMDFGMMLLEKGNVAVSPGSGFGPAGEGFLRMSLVENEARLRQSVRQIQRCLREADGQLGGSSDSASVPPIGSNVSTR